MLELLGQILSLIQDVLISPTVWLFPLKWIIVEPGEAALRYTCGKPGPMLDGGVHFATSTQLLVKEHVQTRVAPTNAVMVLTSDAVPLKVDAVVTYSIHNLAAFFGSAEEPDPHLSAVAEAAIRAAVSARSFPQIVAGTEDLEGEVRKQVAEAVAGCGIKIKRTRLQNIKQRPDYVRMAEKIVPTINLQTTPPEQP